MLQPQAFVLYVDNLALSAKFYEDILGIKPEQSSPSFNCFALGNGMILGLKTKETVEPPVQNEAGGGELAFIVDTNSHVDDLFADWQNKGTKIAQSPTILPYGYSFVALDPDGHRLRVVSTVHK